MSQYQDYFFSDAQPQNEYSILNSPCIEERKFQQVRFLIDNGFFKEALPTEDYPQFTEIAHNASVEVIKQTQDKKKPTKRIKRVIKVEEDKQEKRREIFKGLKDDTTQLNINIKTILYNKFKDLALTKQFGAQDKHLIQQFGKSVPSFGAVKRISKSPRIKQKGLKLIKSSKLAVQILRSQSRIENKLTLIKYIECVKQNFEQQKTIRWKDIKFN